MEKQCISRETTNKKEFERELAAKVGAVRCRVDRIDFYKGQDMATKYPQLYHSADRLPNDYGLKGEALYLHPASVVPDGWKLVPKEPTPQMHEAWMSEEYWRMAYDKMLAAAPEYNRDLKDK